MTANFNNNANAKTDKVLNALAYKRNRVIKRGFDLALSSVVLLLSPVWGLPVALAIKLTSPGPILFKQTRIGRNGKLFGCWKFRTMVPNDQADTLVAMPNDSRLTPIGNFLRATRIDEMPQFFNVLMGDMSVVGPRPHMIAVDEQYSSVVENYGQRYQIKPGITGWAQVEGCRGSIFTNEQMQARIDKDLWYISHWSLGLDLKIIGITAFKLMANDDKK